MKFLPSLTGTMSGSMGGCTASHNRGGNYFRTRVVPTNPNTTRQNAVRGYFAAAVNAWTSVLTPTQRAAWETFAANTPMTDVLGQVLMLTGQQAFIKTNTIRYQLGLSTIADAPTEFNNGQPVAAVQTINASTVGSLGVILLTGAFSFEVTLMDDSPDGGYCSCYLGPPVNPSVNFYKGSYQLAASQSFLAAVTTVGFTTLLASQKNAIPLTVGEFRPVRFTIVYDDGRVATPWEKICPVIDDT